MSAMPPIAIPVDASQRTDAMCHADECDELASFELMELHMPPLPTFNYIPILVNLQECFMYPHGI